MSRRKLALAVLATVTVAATAVGMAVAGKGNGNNKTFEYAVGLWGDTPYSDVQAQTGVPNLIADLNSSDIAFSVHDGDLKAGNAIAGSVTPTTCQNATLPSIYSQGLGYFDSLREPAIFTPGDNDWTDCDRTSNGGFNSLARLEYERSVFFSGDLSLGGFHDILSKLRDETISFRKPVVLVHGDSHYFMIDKPLLDADGRRVENFTRVETFGDHTFSAHPEWDTNDIHWVKALVDPQSRDVFAFQPQVVPANRVAVPAP